MERKVKKRIEDLAKIFNSEETKQVEIRIRYWGFFKVAKWDNTNVRDSAWILYWNPDAKNVIEVDGVKFSPKKNSIYLFPPYTLFSGYNKQPFVQFYIHFDAGAPFTRVKSKMISFPAKELIPLILRTAEQQDEVMQSIMLNTVILRALSEVPQDMFAPEDQTIMDPRIRQAVAIIEKDPGKALSIKELSAMIKMSPNNFYRKFVKELGCSPKIYLQNQRLLYARDLLLNQELQIDEIAARCGFKDRYQFSKAYKKQMCFSPVTYRKRMSRLHNMSSAPESFMNQFQRRNVFPEESANNDFFLKEKLNFAKKLLLRSTLSLTDISFACGFKNIADLSRAVKNHFGKTPQQFRKKEQVNSPVNKERDSADQ